MSQNSKYDDQADQFLSKWGFEVRMVHAGEKLPNWDGENTRVAYSRGQHWRVSVIRLSNRRSRLSFDFWNSVRDTAEGIDLSAYSVLSCLSADSSYGDSPEEIISELGGNPDSRKEWAQAVAAARFSARIRKFFTAEELAALQEIN